MKIKFRNTGIINGLKETPIDPDFDIIPRFVVARYKDENGLALMVGFGWGHWAFGVQVLILTK